MTLISRATGGGAPDIWAEFQIGASVLSFFFKGRAGFLALVLHLTPFLATEGPKGGWGNSH